MEELHVGDIVKLVDYVNHYINDAPRTIIREIAPELSHQYPGVGGEYTLFDGKEMEVVAIGEAKEYEKDCFVLRPLESGRPWLVSAISILGDDQRNIKLIRSAFYIEESDLMQLLQG